MPIFVLLIAGIHASLFVLWATDTFFNKDMWNVVSLVSLALFIILSLRLGCIKNFIAGIVFFLIGSAGLTWFEYLGGFELILTYLCMTFFFFLLLSSVFNVPRRKEIPKQQLLLQKEEK